MTRSSDPSARRPVLGLTGAPAAGKSAVARILAEAGCDVIEADALGHAVLADPAVQAQIADLLGDAVLGPDGLDRAAVARIVFADPAALARLEGIVHPRVRARIAERIVAAREASAPAIVIDAALLFESALEKLCDATICVHAPVEVRAARALSARGWDRAELTRREARQLPAHEKRARADHELDNDSDVAALRARVLNLLARVLNPLDRAAPALPSAPATP